jgi:hypothetical protein
MPRVEDLLLKLLTRFRADAVEYVLVGGQAVPLREVIVDGVPIRVLNIDGLIRTKTDFCEKDILDKQVLRRIKRQLEGDGP